jgi:16S rRNA (guanine527-N7)-methyltransferase
MDWNVALDSGLCALRLVLNSTQKQQLLHYLALLHKWNQVYNLTAITEFKKMLSLHLFDSLTIAPYLQGTHHIDIGTGAGLPGIPLSILCPQHHFTLLDSNGKKTRFLLQAKSALNLNNIEIIQQRAEHYCPQKKFDTILSRAFASLNDMLCRTHSLCAQNGQFLAMKGLYPHSELAAIYTGYQLKAVYRVSIPEVLAERHVVIIVRSV